MDSNIFDSAGKNTNMGNEKSSSHSPLKLPDAGGQEGYGSNDLEMIEMFTKMREMRHDLDAKLGQLRERGEGVNIDVDRLIENTSQFSVAEVERINRDQKTFEEKVNSLFKSGTLIKKMKKSKEKLSKERKGKTLGSRKKWIPVR